MTDDEAKWEIWATKDHAIHGCLTKLGYVDDKGHCNTRMIKDNAVHG